MFHILLSTHQWSFHKDDLYEKCKQYFDKCIRLKISLRHKNNKVAKLKSENRKLYKENLELQDYILKLQNKNISNKEIELQTFSEIGTDDEIEII